MSKLAPILTDPAVFGLFALGVGLLCEGRSILKRTPHSGALFAATMVYLLSLCVRLCVTPVWGGDWLWGLALLMLFLLSAFVLNQIASRGSPPAGSVVWLVPTIAFALGTVLSLLFQACWWLFLRDSAWNHWMRPVWPEPTARALCAALLVGTIVASVATIPGLRRTVWGNAGRFKDQP